MVAIKLKHWIHIHYADPENKKSYRGSSKKDDGEFAYRTKAGEKVERKIANLAKNEFGHSFKYERLHSPGFFEIRYRNKRRREIDLECSCCSLKIEVKARLKDRYFRVSHSEARKLQNENDIEGWHAFGFPDDEFVFVPNKIIYKSLADHKLKPVRDTKDAWVQIPSEMIKPDDLPQCPAEMQKFDLTQSI